MPAIGRRATTGCSRGRRSRPRSDSTASWRPAAQPSVRSVRNATSSVRSSGSSLRCEQRQRLVGGEPKIVLADLAQPAGDAPPAQRQLGVDAAGRHDPHVGGSRSMNSVSSREQRPRTASTWTSSRPTMRWLAYCGQIGERARDTTRPVCCSSGEHHRAPRRRRHRSTGRSTPRHQRQNRGRDIVATGRATPRRRGPRRR